MNSTHFKWEGRFDGDTPEHRRFFQIINQQEIADFTLLGFASDEGIRRNKGRLGAKSGPDHIRGQLASMPIHRPFSLNDAGNVTCDDGDLETAQKNLANKIGQLLHEKSLPIVLGGGHEIAFGSFQGAFNHLRATQKTFQLGIINFDAHFDLRTADIVTSGTPFLNAANLCQAHDIDFNYLCLGIAEHGNTRILFDTADKLNVTYIQDKALTPAKMTTALETLKAFIDRVDYLYITVDLDVFPAAIAPGVSAPAAKGMSLETFETLFEAILASKKILLLDIAECNPQFDIDNRTAKLAALIVYQYINNNL